ncbi:hypothetical protein A8H39_02075 [Paraburkholderia fungorum]|uniref:hypothetical protein n=1 Tax=Paraburkholderia fungorum TaxID=134537 RepID=UPI0004851D5E|nr:hypothetical protein [Paraburkholderia fungorum]PNE59956.1 hypothetical protein A8H39_02075 [Paraburkholderia fungorum]
MNSNIDNAGSQPEQKVWKAGDTVSFGRSNETIVEAFPGLYRYSGLGMGSYYSSSHLIEWLENTVAAGRANSEGVKFVYWDAERAIEPPEYKELKRNLLAAKIPESVQFYVKHALSVLHEQEAALHGVQLARGNGYILALELKDREGKITQAMNRLGEFRDLAGKNGVDAEAFILASGGIPDLGKFGYPKLSGEDRPEHEYAFDCTLTAAIRVKGPSREAAEAHLRDAMDAADCNGGAWANGDPILFEASVNDNELTLYEVDGDPVDDAKLRASGTGHRPDPAGAKLFFEELIASVETLGSIADQHGVNTLTDLMYLQQAILDGETIDVWPGESEVGEVVQALPSADRWRKYTDLAQEWKKNCVRVDNRLPSR